MNIDISRLYTGGYKTAYNILASVALFGFVLGIVSFVFAGVSFGLSFIMIVPSLYYSIPLGVFIIGAVFWILGAIGVNFIQHLFLTK